jgi:hypothetical protein
MGLAVVAVLAEEAALVHFFDEDGLDLVERGGDSGVAGLLVASNRTPATSGAKKLNRFTVMFTSSARLRLDIARTRAFIYKYIFFSTSF